MPYHDFLIAEAGIRDVAQRKDFPEQNSEGPNIRLGGEDAFVVIRTVIRTVTRTVMRTVMRTVIRTVIRNVPFYLPDTLPAASI